MTYEDRQRYRDLREGVERLRDRLDTGAPQDPVTREEARALLSLLEVAVERLSPERWDNALDAIAGEAARRAEAMAAGRHS